MAVMRARITIALVLMACATGAGADEKSDATRLAISGLHWADSNDWIHNPPGWLREIEESRRLRAPMPVVHLWRSQRMQTLLCLGVNRRGLPGLYIARTLPY